MKLLPKHTKSLVEPEGFAGGGGLKERFHEGSKGDQGGEGRGRGHRGSEKLVRRLLGAVIGGGKSREKISDQVNLPWHSIGKGGGGGRYAIVCWGGGGLFWWNGSK